VYAAHLKTVLLHRSGWELSYPIIELNSVEQLLLSFDDLTNQQKDYRFRIIHCDRYWRPSNMEAYEFIDEIPDNRILNFTHSFSTYTPYVHYQLLLPVRTGSSGNRVIM